MLCENITGIVTLFERIKTKNEGLIDVASAIDHNFRAPLARILSILSQMYDKYDELGTLPDQAYENQKVEIDLLFLVLLKKSALEIDTQIRSLARKVDKVENQ